jgi:hypothetical protein
MFTSISSATLRKMIKLSKRKEELMSQIQEIDRQMAGIEREVEVRASLRSPRRTRLATRIPSRSKPNQRGALKAKILAALRRARRRGMTVGQLSKKLGVKSANLYVWFADTGRNVRGLRKIAPAKYRLG